MAKKHSNPEKANAKLTDLAKHTEQDQESFLTTNQGLCINDDQNSLKTGERGPTLMEDFIFREKLLISITSAFPKGLFMHGVVVRMVFLNAQNPCRNIPKQNFCKHLEQLHRFLHDSVR